LGREIIGADAEDFLNPRLDPLPDTQDVRRWNLKDP
jgi:hypothetical protein